MILTIYLRESHTPKHATKKISNLKIKYLTPNSIEKKNENWEIFQTKIKKIKKKLNLKKQTKTNKILKYDIKNTFWI